MLAGTCILLRIQQALHDWREARISALPDPFIEDAPERAKSHAVATHSSGPSDASEPDAPKAASPSAKTDDEEKK
jgi:hypothetical protein